jgi:hypothetical protein
MTDVRRDQAQGVLNALEMSNIGVRLEDGQLILAAPKGSLTAEDREVLADLKPELIELLTPSPRFAPMPWRDALANASIEFRERWGYRANELEEGGMPWREAEEQAYRELMTAIQSQAA